MKTTGKLNIFEPKKSHHFVDLDKLILKMYTVLRFQIVFHKVIEEIWKKIWVQISYSFYIIIEYNLNSYPSATEPSEKGSLSSTFKNDSNPLIRLSGRACALNKDNHEWHKLVGYTLVTLFGLLKLHCETHHTWAKEKNNNDVILFFNFFFLFLFHSSV